MVTQLKELEVTPELAIELEKQLPYYFSQGGVIPPNQALAGLHHICLGVKGSEEEGYELGWVCDSDPEVVVCWWKVSMARYFIKDGKGGWKRVPSEIGVRDLRNFGNRFVNRYKESMGVVPDKEDH